MRSGFRQAKKSAGIDTMPAPHGLLMAYVPIDLERVLVSNNHHLTQQLKREGYAYTITYLREPEEQEPDMRYIPIPGLRYSMFAYSDSIRSLSTEAMRYLEILHGKIGSAVV